MNYRIVADENIPFAREIFGRLGEVNLLPGRAVTAADLAGADVLMVRSVTKVDAPLLAGTPVRFVGTATIGTDHIDQSWLAGQGIGFASAPGCNAESVAQYIAAALYWAAGRKGWALGECSLGIVGVGNCGRRVERIARALGMRVLLNDPPLERATGDPKYRPLAELLDCNFLTLHVPLTREGPDATWRLFDTLALACIKPGAVLINACRGFVVDEASLTGALDAGHLGGAILDAWEGEPCINPALARRLMLGTPHIAGYSFDGKVTGTRMIYEAACRHLGLEAEPVRMPMPAPSIERISLDAAGRSRDSVFGELIQAAYPIGRDSADLMQVLSEDPEAMGRAFDQRRKLYPTRREFEAVRVRLRNAPEDWAGRLREAGFTLED